ncbi:hypothetical protein BH10ACI2_BH10ACI2_02940 [soil metagenome]
MKLTSRKLIFGSIVLISFAWLVPQTAIGQTEKLGIIKYTPPKGMTKTLKENVVAFSEFDQKSGKYCLITVYGATPGTGTPQRDFDREWNNLVVKTLDKAESNPKPDTSTADGWTIMAAGSAVESGAGKAVAFLTVISGSGKTVSILAVFNDPDYVKLVDTFISGVDLDKTPPPTNTASAQPRVENGKLVVPLPNRQLTLADLAGEWGEDASRVSTTYVDRSSGAYVGTDNLSFRSKMSFNARGGYLNDFYEIRNGKKLIENTTGSFSVDGRVLSIKHDRSIAKYVIRGWLELPEMTILVICGPWYENDAIPAEIFSNPVQGANLNKTWVRKK